MIMRGRRIAGLLVLAALLPCSGYTPGAGVPADSALRAEHLAVTAACDDAWVGPVFGEDASSGIEVILPRVPGGCELRVRSVLSRSCSPAPSVPGGASSCTAESCGATTLEIRAGGKVLGTCREPPQCSAADEDGRWRWRGKGRGAGVVCEASLGVFNDAAALASPHGSATEGAPTGRQGVGETWITELEVNASVL